MPTGWRIIVDLHPGQDVHVLGDACVADLRDAGVTATIRPERADYDRGRSKQ